MILEEQFHGSGCGQDSYRHPERFFGDLSHHPDSDEGSDQDRRKHHRVKS